MATQKAFKGAEMTVDIRVVRANDFIRTTPRGDLNLEASCKVIQDLSTVLKYTNHFHVLIDVRDTTVNLSMSELFFLGNAVASSPRLVQSKTAVLGNIGQPEKDQFFELVARNRGANLKAFTSFEEAVNWLVFDETGPGRQQ